MRLSILIIFLVILNGAIHQHQGEVSRDLRLLVLLIRVDNILQVHLVPLIPDPVGQPLWFSLLRLQVSRFTVKIPAILSQELPELILASVIGALLHRESPILECLSSSSNLILEVELMDWAHLRIQL